MIKQTTLALAALVAGSSVQAQEASALSVTVDVSYVTDYVFRGAQLGNASIQPSVEAAYGDFYAGVWASNPVSNDADLSEVDLYAGYGLAVTDIISADFGVTRYTYEGGSGGDSTEVYVGLAADMMLNPSLYYYYDFDYEVNSVILSVGHSLPVGAINASLDAINASLDFAASAGYINRVDADDYTYASVGVAIPYSLSETATLTVGVEYIYNDTDAFFNGDNDGIVGKAGISIGF